VPAAPLVRELRDLVRGHDYALHHIGRVLRRHGRAVAEHPRAPAGLEERRRVEVLLEFREVRARLAQLGPDLRVRGGAGTRRIVGGVDLEGGLRTRPAELHDLRLEAPVRLLLARVGARLPGRLGGEHHLLGLGLALASALALGVAAARRDEEHRAERDGERAQPPVGAWCLDFHSSYGMP
jgi:hypothetical protein